MDANPFVGTWRLMSWESRDADGRITYPFGQDAIGYLMYTVDGYMHATLMTSNRSPFVAGDILGGTIEEQAAAAATYISYAGPYEVHEGKVVHHVEVSLFPNWVGSTQERVYEFSGDRLSLSTAPLLQGGSERRAYLFWQRAREW